MNPENRGAAPVVKPMRPPAQPDLGVLRGRKSFEGGPAPESSPLVPVLVGIALLLVMAITAFVVMRPAKEGGVRVATPAAAEHADRWLGPAIAGVAENFIGRIPWRSG